MPPPSRPAIRLLIVDDDDALRQTLARRFQRDGWAVTEAVNGTEAIALAERKPFDVALLDLHLPDTTGVALLGRIKEAQAELEAVMLTAHGSMETAIDAMKRGAYDYLTKPFHLPELDAHLQKAYEKVCLSRRERQWVGQ